MNTTFVSHGALIRRPPFAALPRSRCRRLRASPSPLRPRCGSCRATRTVVGTPKDHERREVPVPTFLVDELATHVFDAAAERAGVGDVTPHGLRHTAASLAIAAGATVVLVQRMLGHSSPSVTLNVYSHLFADDLDTVADRLHQAKINSDADQVRTGRPVSVLPTIKAGDRDAV
ncbi:hypothetical protein GCM10009609_13830 [Pseudonocardia aurantiaca]|uniref:Tyrosine-type recombinase/integrase n=1 Tax=Pseudonocardia aurantiaca TaxID=75290 RepID=A0ABW4FC44_9PSEU